MHCHSLEWTHEMTLKMTRIITTLLVSGVLAAPAVAADDKDADAKMAAANVADAAKLNRKLAESATTAAVEDAVEAVLAENKLDLDIRFIGRTSVKIADGR